MAYEPTEWLAGDKITDVKLNKIEQGIADNQNVFYVGVSYSNEQLTLDHTWQQIKNAMDSNKLVVVKGSFYYAYDEYNICGICEGYASESNIYAVFVRDMGTSSEDYSTLSASGYPQRSLFGAT